MRFILKALVGLVAVLLVLAVAASFHPEVQNVYRALSPSEDYDTEPPALPGDLGETAILIFTKTNGFRHTEAIDLGLEYFKELAARRGWSIFHTENSAVHNSEALAKFKVVIWHNASGAPVNEEQRADLKTWIANGGGFVGIHSATDDSHAGWPWYQQELVGAKFIGHTMGPQFQEATLRIDLKSHVAVRHIIDKWQHVEEWYSYDRSVRDQTGVQVLASVDETTYSPRLRFLWTDDDLAMGDHPIIWTRTVGRGRAFFSALGHAGDAYKTAQYKGVLEGAVEWAGQIAQDSAE
jgi:type 1 glutamine amidotransferase